MLYEPRYCPLCGHERIIPLDNSFCVVCLGIVTARDDTADVGLQGKEVSDMVAPANYGQQAPRQGDPARHATTKD